MKSIYKHDRRIHIDDECLAVIAIILVVVLLIAAAVHFVRTTQLQDQYFTMGTLISKSTNRVHSGKQWVTRYYLMIHDDETDEIHKKSVNITTYRNRYVGDVYKIHHMTYHSTWLGFRWHSVYLERWYGE